MDSIPILRDLAELKGLEVRLRRKIEGVPHIDVELSDTVLTLDLNLNRGFNGYERVEVFPHQGNLYLDYLGLYRLAFDTFLGDEYAQDIAKSELLTKLKTRVEQIKGESEVEGKERGEPYSRLIIEKEKSNSYQEIEEALYFFCRVFEDKAIHQI